METSIGEIIKLAFTIGTPISIIIWHLYKKLEGRMEQLEKRTNDNEKTLIELRTDFKYIREDIADIKTMLVKLSEK